MLFPNVLLVVSALYVVYAAAALWISRGIRREFPKQEEFPEVSIVVPARNEEGQIGRLLDSLLAVDYPPEKLQIVVMNDQSTDRTREIGLSYSKRFQCRFELHDVTCGTDDRLVAKTRALSQGLQKATSEIVLMTDADCVVPPNWVRCMSSYFTPDVGMVCGMTIPDPEPDGHPMLTAFETLDWMFLLGASTGLSGLGRPKGLIGNNYSVRKSTYDEIGTYDALRYTSPYDDLALMNAVAASGKRVVAPSDAGALLYTKPISSLPELAVQRQRWLRGMPRTGPLGNAIILFGILAHVTLPMWFLFGGIWGFIPYLLLVTGDSFVIRPMMRQYRHGGPLWRVLWYPGFATIYGVMMVWRSLFKREIPWKDRSV
jgi:cellulose synthase/poly-beta-1,6-N-acetylglucosamine synthase-like glycosyltransferase